MTEKQLLELKAGIKALHATLLAGFGTMAGLEHAATRARQLGRELTTAEWMTEVHNGLDTVLMLRDNAVQELSKSADDSKLPDAI